MMNLDVDKQPRFSNLENNLKNHEESIINTWLKVIPTELTFMFDSMNINMQCKILEVTNYSTKPCPIEILSPETHYFRITNISQRKWLSPGFVLKINVNFIPDEMRDYNDILKIRSLSNEIISIKMSAKFTSKFCFPTNVDFGNVPLGLAACYEIPIHSSSKKAFSFAVLPSKEDPCVDIYPRWGHVRPAEKPVAIMVIYRPLKYVSMNFQIRIFISDLCKTPYTVNFYAYSRPGLLRETLELSQHDVGSTVQPKSHKRITLKQGKGALSKRDSSKCPATIPVNDSMNNENIALRKLINLSPYTLHAVNCVLNSKVQSAHGKNELRESNRQAGPLNIYSYHSIEERWKRQNEFLEKADELREQNERARIHHKPKVNYGTRDIDNNEIIDVQIQREQAWGDYKDSLMMTCREELLERQEATKIRQRILRDSKKLPNTISTIPGKGERYLRNCKLVLFLQAARKVVLKNRLLLILEKLRRFNSEVITQFGIPPTEY